MTVDFKGKAIYRPAGKAGEYAEWACNFYVGCSNECEYCYLKKGRGAKILGGDKPTLKKCFVNESNAMVVFEKELIANLAELQKHGLFYSFTTDPMLPETSFLTFHTAMIANENGVPVKILTKCAGEWVNEVIEMMPQEWRSMLAFGFTLTGHDEREPNASTNAERIEAMRKLHEVGFKTFASIEPIIVLQDSFDMICDTNCICDLYKIGLESGKKYDKKELNKFVKGVINQVDFYEAKIYFKDSLLKQAEINREELPENCVGKDYNLFKALSCS